MSAQLLRKTVLAGRTGREYVMEGKFDPNTPGFFVARAS